MAGTITYKLMLMKRFVTLYALVLPSFSFHKTPSTVDWRNIVVCLTTVADKLYHYS